MDYDFQDDPPPSSEILDSRDVAAMEEVEQTSSLLLPRSLYSAKPAEYAFKESPACAIARHKKKLLNQRAFCKYLMETSPGTNTATFFLRKPLFVTPDSSCDPAIGDLTYLNFVDVDRNKFMECRINMRLKQKQDYFSIMMSFESLKEISFQKLGESFLPTKMIPLEKLFPSRALIPQAGFEPVMTQVGIGYFKLALPPRSMISTDNPIFWTCLGYDGNHPGLKSDLVAPKFSVFEGGVGEDVTTFGFSNESDYVQIYYSNVHLASDKTFGYEFEEQVRQLKKTPKARIDRIHAAPRGFALQVSFMDYDHHYNNTTDPLIQPFKTLTSRILHTMLNRCISTLSASWGLPNVTYLKAEASRLHLNTVELSSVDHSQEPLNCSVEVIFNTKTANILNVKEGLLFNLEDEQCEILTVKQPGQWDPFKGRYPIIIKPLIQGDNKNYIEGGGGFCPIMGMIRGHNTPIISCPAYLDLDNFFLSLSFSDESGEPIVFKKKYEGSLWMSFKTTAPP